MKALRRSTTQYHPEAVWGCTDRENLAVTASQRFNIWGGHCWAPNRRARDANRLRLSTMPFISYAGGAECKCTRALVGMRVRNWSIVAARLERISNRLNFGWIQHKAKAKAAQFFFAMGASFNFSLIIASSLSSSEH